MFSLTSIRPLTRVASRRVLVVGGGIAGLQAALEVTAAGLPVTLVETGPSLGGLMAQLDKTFPTNDCAMCILSPRMLEISRHPLVEILTLTRVLQVAGRAGDFRVLLESRPRYVELDRCTGCGECARVCPQKIPDPYNLAFSRTKAIHVPFPQAIPQGAYVDAQACRRLRGKKCRACEQACPSSAINFDQRPAEPVQDAGAIILAAGARPASVETFPGYEHPDVVTSLEFERLLSATGPHGGKLRRPSDQTEPARLAFIQCVGSRDLQAGAAYCSSVCCLASLKEALVAQEISGGSAAATIFYMDLRAQGKGYESYLEQAQSRGVQLIRSRVTGVQGRPGGGVQVRYTDGQGRPQAQAFDLAVLAAGLRPPPGLPQWASRLDLDLNPHGFLKTSPLAPGRTRREGVLVCGTAREPMDIPESVTSAGAAAAAAAQLLTVGHRTLVPRALLPDGPAAEASPRIGVFLCHCGTNIAKTVELESLGAMVRQLPEVVHVEERLFACAVESTNRMAETIRTLGLNRVVVAACTPRTHEPVFREVLTAAGLNPGFLAFANIREQCSWVHQADPAAALAKAQRLVAMAVRRARALTPIRRQTFPVTPRALVVGGGVAGMSGALQLADQGFHTYLVEREAHLGGVARRLHFTLEGPAPQEFLQELQSLVYTHPNIEVLTRTELLRVEGYVGQFRSTVRRRTLEGMEERRLEHGVVLVATGGQEFHPEGRFGYGMDPRILTQLELEAKINAGDLELPQARRVVMIQCVGSREPDHPYCSRLCCAEALKNALLLKDRFPWMEVSVLYRDLRAYGFRESYYQQAKERGVVFFPYEAARPPQVATPRFRPLAVRVWDTLLEREVDFSADLVILSAGIRPARGGDLLARQLGISRTTDGFFQEAHPKLRPVDAGTEGIFLCGLAHYPKSLGETVAQAQAAALRAAGILFRTELDSGELLAAITPEKCRRCLACVGVCPFGAVRLADSHPAIAAGVCRGCGVCVAECPAGAISLSRGAEPEVAAQIEAALE